jgi:methionyl-tRNA synthetase
VGYTACMEYVSYDEFKKMDMRVGTIKSVVPVDGADKLLKCMIDFGETEVAPIPEMADENQVSIGVPTQIPKLRQIVSGIREFFPEYEKLVGKQVLYIVNLEPRVIRGVESHGMLMAVDGKDGKPVFLTPEIEVGSGSKVR